MQAPGFTLAAPLPTVWSSLRVFAGTRLVVVLILFLSIYLSSNKAFDINLRSQSLLVVGLYGFAALIFVILCLRVRQDFYRLLLTQVICDFMALGWLVVTTEGLKSGLGLLFLLPIAGTAALTPLLLSLLAAALGSLSLLLEAWLRSATDGMGSFMLAGLNGMLFFAMAIFVNRVAHRLIQQEILVREREQRIQIQLELNRLIIRDLDNGVVVLDEGGNIQAANHAAQRILGSPSGQDNPASLTLLPRWRQVKASLQKHRMQKNSLEAPTIFRTEMILKFTDGVPQAPRVQLRFFTPSARWPLHTEAVHGGGAGTVIMMQDLSQVEMRAQQLKLASLGRLSASIAHEIRNPLSAIRHASALLKEEENNPAARRLTQIIELNSQRINRIIEDILQMSRRDSTEITQIDLQNFLPEMLADYERNHQILTGRIHVKIELPEHIRVKFSAMHLQRILDNLLNNACRYASHQMGAIQVWAGLNEGNVVLALGNDGPSLTEEQQSHLFEPFYTSEAQGTGLGLFLSRELCEANGARLSYDPRPPWFDFSPARSSAFMITFVARS